MSTDKTELTSEVAFLGCLGAIALTPLVALLDGWAMAVMWRWFVVPIFHIQALGVAPCCGLVVLAALLTHQDSKRSVEGWALYALYVVRPLMLLGIGWIVRLFL